MPVISVSQAFNEEDLYVHLRAVIGRALFLKCEGLNFAGSIKLKAAAEMVAAAEREGALTRRSILVESSSGHLGVALSIIAAGKGYHFLCVTDARCNLATRLMMEALGSQVHMVSGTESNGGFPGARLDYVRDLRATDDRCVWLSQYTNPANWRAHHRTTAPAIARFFPDLDVLFVGGTPGRRMIPGLGMSVRPPLLDDAHVDDVLAAKGPTPSAPATAWRLAASCSADRRARWSAVRRAGWNGKDTRA